ncbi:K-like proteiny domain [Sesbania bispinosa]|nr:K-like proteiny domain [Sesbania bispinosa]
MATAEPTPNGTGSSQPLAEATAAEEPETTEKRWPGWPGHCVFRLIVPVLKVGGIIGRKGELIKKTREETRARIRVLDAPLGTPDRIVLVSGKEEPEAPFSPAMDAESTGASVRVLSGDELPFYAGADERIVELQGENFKVLKALEAVVGHLRKFLVDHSVLPLFEKTCNVTISQDRQADAWADKPSLHSASQPSIVADIPLSTKRDSLFADRESHLDSLLPSSTMSLYGQDSSLSGLRSSALGRAAAPPIVTTVIQTMQIPLSYAEDIIGIQGTNIDYIRRTSGAILTVQESRVPDEIIVEIKGTSSQVQTAQQLIQEVISNHKEPVASSYSRLDAGLRSSYPQLGSSSYSSSSLSSQPYSGYGSSGLGGSGYSTFRL